MAQALAGAALQNNIDALYGLLGQDPYILDSIDAIPFVQTPLHTAASVGSAHFAIEILRLKPSFGKKLNPDGFSALDLALRGGHTQTVRGLIKHDPQLIRVKGKRGITPFHYVAEAEDRADLLAEFLYRCPKSIEDLTIVGESAVHIAVKESNLRGFEVLLGWMVETGNKHILGWEDENGNTVLHLAASSRDNIEVVRLIIKHLRYDRRRVINCCNVADLTALDIALGHPNAEEKGSIATVLRSTGAKRSSSSHSRTINLAKYCALILERSLLGTLFGKCSIQVKAPNPRAPRIISTSSENRNAVIVVAVLIITATYHAILSPPGGVISLSTDSSNDRTPDSTNAGHGNPQAVPAPAPSITENPENKSLEAGTAQGRHFPFGMFLTFNSILFISSLSTIYLLNEANDLWERLLRLPIVYFSFCYIFSVIIIAPSIPPVLIVVIVMLGMLGLTLRIRHSLSKKIMRQAILSEAENTTPKGNQ